MGLLITLIRINTKQVSDEEVAFLTNGDPQDENVVLSLWFDGLKLLIVTDGEKGCRYFTKVSSLPIYLFIRLIINLFVMAMYVCLTSMQDFKGKVSGFAVKTIDTTGAGDAFVGALLVSLAKDSSLFQVLFSVFRLLFSAFHFLCSSTL